MSTEELEWNKQYKQSLDSCPDSKHVDKSSKQSCGGKIMVKIISANIMIYIVNG